jgi:hypothetical protein
MKFWRWAQSRANSSLAEVFSLFCGKVQGNLPVLGFEDVVVSQLSDVNSIACHQNSLDAKTLVAQDRTDHRWLDGLTFRSFSLPFPRS